MKKYGKELSRAAVWIGRKQYTKAIRFLEPKVPIYLEDARFYYLLGTALYYSGDMGGARFYFERGLLADRDDLDMRLMLAMTHFRRKDSPEVAKVWLSILERDPVNKKATRGLEILRKIDNEADLNRFIKEGKHRKIMPPPFRRPLLPFFGSTAALVLLIGLIVAVIPKISLPEKEAHRDELNYIDLDISGIAVTDNSGSFHYVLTVDEIRNSYNRAIELFDKRQDNKAQVEINRILNSNASGDLKSRLAVLDGYLLKPDYTDFYTDYTYSQVVAEPLLYENCWVLWRGRLTNLTITNERISFLFLVGFENETFLEGSLPGFIEYGVKIDQELPVEILGRLVRENGDLILKVETIRHILPE
jgi:tetratricopeptide (TPR) repeat protein